MAESMAEVLAAIIAGVDEANNWDASPEMYQKYADAILAAGFGLVADAGAKALEDAAEEFQGNRAVITGPRLRTWLRARAAAVRGEDAHD